MRGQGEEQAQQQRAPLLSHYDSEEPGIEQEGSRKGSCHWLQTTSALLALQLGWGLWLFVSDFSGLGWYPALGCLVVLALASFYSATLFTRLFANTPGAVLFGDIGFAAAGAFGRNLVYSVFYSLNATRGLILHLACSQALHHVFKAETAPPLWQCGVAVFVVVVTLVQIRSLARLSVVFVVGTCCQLCVVAFVLYDLITDPDPEAHTTTNNIKPGNYRLAFVSLMNMVFAFGGQFAFVEIMTAMKQPSQFPRAAFLCTTSMALLYACLGSMGYKSRGDSINGIIIFQLGDGPLARASAGLILVTAISQYLVNLNVWTHNLLVLISRCNLGKSGLKPVDGYGTLPDEEEKQCPKCASDHLWQRWLAVSLFVVSYSFAISMSVPYFNLLVGLITGATYLLAAYALPAWFMLCMNPERMHFLEKCLLWSLIPLAIAVSIGGFYSSLLELLGKIHADGVGHGWHSDPSAPDFGSALLILTGLKS